MKHFFTFLMAMSIVFSMQAQYIYNDYDANQNVVFDAWPNMPVIVLNPDISGINGSANVAQWERSDWAQWDNVYSVLTGKIDFTSGTVFSIKIHSPIICDVMFKLEDSNNGGIFVERLQSITSDGEWVQLDFDFSGEASDTYDKVVFFIDFATLNPNTFYFDDIEGPTFGTAAKPLEATDVRDNFENNGYATINDWIFQDPGLVALPVTTDPVDPSNNVADYNRSGSFEWTNTQAELDHRMDLTTRNVFEMDVYFPSSNDYSGSLSSAVGLKLQNSLMGGNGWMTQTEIVQTVDQYDQWVTVSFDFSAIADSVNYDKIVVQFGGEGHWVSGQFYFDNFELLPWYPTPAFTYNDFDDNQNFDFSGSPNMPEIIANPDAGGINTSANVAEWVRSTDQWAHMYTILDGPVNFTNGTNFQIKVHSPVSCNVLFKLENKDNPGIFIEQMATIWDVNEWTLLNFDFPGAQNDLYSKIVIFLDFASTNDNTFYIDDIVGPDYDPPKPVLAIDVQDNFEDDGWSTIDYWIFQNPNMDTLIPTVDPIDPDNTVGDYNRTGVFEWANAQTILNHRLDLSERNKFEMDVYFPSSNDHSGDLATTAAIKLQNSLLGGNAWTTQTEVIIPVDQFDQWVTLLFDFSAVADSINYDQIVIQFGGEGHWAPGQFYFDDLFLWQAPYVTLVDPNGGEIIEMEANYLITWTHGNWDGNVKIEILKDGDSPVQLASNIPVSDESYDWFVTDEVGIGDDFKIIISNIDANIPSDSSDNFFSIIEPNILPNLVFTEIMYNPPESGVDSLEFVEIYNNSLDTVELEGFYFSEGIEFIFPDVEMLPNAFLLVAVDSIAMWSTFGVDALQWTSGGLSNGGEDIELKDGLDNVVDFVDYDDSPPWDTLADGYGPSLTLCNPDSDNELPENWTHSVNYMAVNAAGDSIWATPGFNCQVQLFAGFEGDTTLVVIGDGVLFADLTIGDPISWSWTFEGGIPETFSGQNPPKIVYDAAGRWDVSLIVDDGMNIDSVIYEEYIWAGIAPVADFVAEQTDITVGTSTNFTSLSTGDSLSFYWTFEGGTPENSADENPLDIFYNIWEDSFYDVTLVVTNEFGTDTLTKEEYIHTTPVGIGDNILTQNSVNLFPNPTKDMFTIALPDGVDVEILLTDISGKEILRKNISSEQKLRLQGLKKGIYLVRVLDINSKAMVVKKLVIN